MTNETPPDQPFADAEVTDMHGNPIDDEYVLIPPAEAGVQRPYPVPFPSTYDTQGDVLGSAHSHWLYNSAVRFLRDGGRGEEADEVAGFRRLIYALFRDDRMIVLFLLGMPAGGKVRWRELGKVPADQSAI